MESLLAQYCELAETHTLQRDWVMLALPRDSAVQISTRDKSLLLTKRTFLVIRELSPSLPLRKCHLIKVKMDETPLDLPNLTVAHISGLAGEILKIIRNRNSS